MKLSKLRVLVLMSVDSLVIVGSILISYFFYYDTIPQSSLTQMLLYLSFSVVLGILLLWRFKLYNRMWRYASIGEIVSIFKAVSIACVIAYAAVLVATAERIPLAIFLRTYETVLLGIGGSRFVWRIYRDNYARDRDNKNRALIIGAGDCGMMVVREMKQAKSANLYPVAFIDDDVAKHGQQVGGLPVVGDRNAIIDTVNKMGIDEIIVAIPSMRRQKISEILDICKMTKAKLKIVPGLSDLISGKVTLQEMRDVDVEDLLGRDPVELQLDGIADYLTGKTVLVTGAGGSIGSELCRQIAPFSPSRLLLLGHGENSIYQIDKELRVNFPELECIPIIADVQDRQRIEQVFDTYRPQVVFHAAAHKHVPLMEANPGEAIKNNVFGTKNVAEVAEQYKADRFVLISTDKAVNPTSIMGATKRIAEMFIQCLDSNSSHTRFSAVRFGNVLGSRGSVIPLFKEQIAAGGPVTVTHPEMIRYFMTIPEASKLVIQAGSYAKGGEVFILDMGEPVRIEDLASDLIRLSGYEPNVDIMIQYTGIRKGEKLFEELLTSEEIMSSTKHERIFIGKPTTFTRNEIEFELKKLEKVLGEQMSAVSDVIEHIVPEYAVTAKGSAAL